MVPTLKGESGWKQWYADGRVVRGIVNSRDTGVCQINLDYWGAEARAMGLDIENSITDNMQMCRYIYDQQGITAWHYWNNHLAYAW
jgi:hypothetical protein